MPILLHDVTIYGVALNDFGFTEWNAIDGYGLNSFGFIWSCQNIWFGPYYTNGLTITTGWTLTTGWSVGTSWTLTSGATVSTTWTPFSTYYEEDC